MASDSAPCERSTSSCISSSTFNELEQISSCHVATNLFEPASSPCQRLTIVFLTRVYNIKSLLQRLQSLQVKLRLLLTSVICILHVVGTLNMNVSSYTKYSDTHTYVDMASNSYIKECTYFDVAFHIQMDQQTFTCP